MLKALRYQIEYSLVSIALNWIQRHTFDQCAARASWVARTWLRFDRKRRRISIENIIKAGITADKAEAEAIAVKSIEHFALVIIESLKTRDFFTQDNWKDKVEIAIPEESMELLKKKGQGVLLLSCHLGNWEIASRLLSFIKPVTGITRDAKNPRVNELVKQHKPSERFTLTPKHDADPTRLLSVLRKGEILALLTDQYAMSYGIRMPFFGHVTSVHKSPALLHLVTKAPIIFGTCIRTGPLQFRIEASKPLNFPPTGNKEEDIKRILEDIIPRTEDLIRRYPEKYLWAHNRWR
jgi:KDO2-lipid IV(A) lauroyltransferase